MATIGGKPVEARPKKVKPKCRFWEDCFRKDKAHFENFSHPTDGDDDDAGKTETTAKKGKVDLSDLWDKEVVFTGTLKNTSGRQATAQARAKGCNVSLKVTSLTDIVICGMDPGAKADEAKKLGCLLLSEEEWDKVVTKAGKGGGGGGDTKQKKGDTSDDAPKTKLKRQRTHTLSDDEDEVHSPKKTPLTRSRSGSLKEVQVVVDGTNQVMTVTRTSSTETDEAMDTTPGPAKASKRGAEKEDSEEGPSSKKAKKVTATVRCKYWDKCFRKDPNHKRQFLHPGDPGADAAYDPKKLPKAKNTIKVGEEIDMKHGTPGKVFKIKRTYEDTYACSCIGWKIQSKPANQRTCVHIKEYLGLPHEKVRVGAKEETVNKGGEATIFRSIKHKSVSLLLAHKWEESSHDPTGWWMSEKLDGVRAFWDGRSFYSRLGNEFIPPPSFVENYPTDMHLDGELFGGRGRFQDTVAIVKNAGSARWSEVKYYVFDTPNVKAPFEERISKITKYFEENDCATVHPMEHVRCRGKDHLLEDLEKVEEKGGEGVMIREPKSNYERCRSKTLLKIKTFYDAEAVVIGYEKGKGRNASVVGALRCRMACGKEFSCGSGLTDKDRRSPPKKGAIITYRFQEYTKNRSPRFPTFQGVRIDATGPSDAVVKKGAGDED